MNKLEVFDPPMCCSTGVCGPAPDERLAVFSADLDWLRRQGVEVQRHNLSQEPTAFTGHPEVARLLQETDGDCLPILVASGQVVSQATYPSRQQLATWAGLNGAAAPGPQDGEAKQENSAPAESESIFNERVAELVAIGAAIASNCESCLEYHYRKATALGISDEDMIEAVNVALQVKEQPARLMVRTAQRLLVPQASQSAGCTPGGGCCG